MLSFGPTIEERAAMDFCLRISDVLQSPNGKESAIKIISTLLDNLKKSKGDAKLLTALIKELVHCHPGLIAELKTTHPDLITASILAESYPKDQNQQILAF